MYVHARVHVCVHVCTYKCICIPCLAVKHYTEAFLLTYYTFIEPEDLISKMLLRLVMLSFISCLWMYMYVAYIHVRAVNKVCPHYIKEVSLLIYTPKYTVGAK